VYVSILIAVAIHELLLTDLRSVLIDRPHLTNAQFETLLVSLIFLAT